jgi:hypothetical protein
MRRGIKVTGDLKKLENFRDALLLAEMAAWLHDFKKCSDENVVVQAYDRPNNAQGLKKEFIDTDLIPNPPDIHLLNNTISFNELVKKGGRGNDNDMTQHWITRAMRRCHKAAHIEKEDPDDINTSRQQVHDTRLSNPFGFEGNPLNGLTNKLKSIPYELTNRYLFLKKIHSAFVCAPGDTRRPENEVTLWDWSFVVAALYKAAIAKAVLTNIFVNPSQISWKLFSIRFAGLEYLQNSQRISDLLARREIIQDSLNRVKNLLEEEYPLAMEVYRDENGSVYVFPDIENLLLYKDENGRSLRDIILNCFDEGTVKSNPTLSLNGELVPALNEDNLLDKWRAQLPNRTYELPPMKKHLYKRIFLQNSAYEVIEWWSSHQEEVCIVCGMRPQGYGAVNRDEHYNRIRSECSIKCQTCKAIERNVCWVCEERRADRSKNWSRSLKDTIWMDEITDVNRRIALMVGFFDLNPWIEGNMIKTLAVKVEDGAVTNKNPSFARIRRVWETTRNFWDDIQMNFSDIIDNSGPRLQVTGNVCPEKDKDTLGLYHAYQLLLGNANLSVVWDSKNQRFITADNIDAIAEPTRLGENVESWLKAHIGKHITIEEPTGYGSQNKKWGSIKIENVEPIQDSKYTPAIPILAEPRTFMALVPADKALNLVSKINEKYEREMGKVRNRLPLHLGVVFAPHKTPLRTILDAGRRMIIEKTAYTDGWEVVKKEYFTKDAELLPETLRNDPHFTECVRLKLARDNHTAVWHVPLSMGDGKTKDNWYPYVFVQHDKNENTPSGRKRMFEAPCPWNLDSNNTPQPTWLVHAKDIEEHDVIYFTPSTLDFQWLDTSGRRFEIDYDNKGRRRDMPQRPYMLEDLNILRGEIWETLKKYLSTSQIHVLYELIETKRYEWEVSDSEVFRKFCYDVIANVEWKKHKIHGSTKSVYPWKTDTKPPEKDWLTQWADYAVRGCLSDVIELYMKVLKEKPEN